MHYTRIRREQLQGFQTTVTQSPMEVYRRLEVLLGRYLPGQSLSLFAMPQITPDGQAIDWMTPLTGQPVPVNQLPPDQRRHVLEVLDARLTGLQGLIERLPKEDADAVLLREALQLPGEYYVYAVGNQPVLAMWGYKQVKKSAYKLLNRIVAASDGSSGSDRRGWRQFFLLLLLLPLLLVVLAWFLFKPCNNGWLERLLPQLAFICPASPEELLDPALISEYVNMRKEGEALQKGFGSLQDTLAETLANCPDPDPEPEIPVTEEEPEEKPCTPTAQDVQAKKTPLLAIVFDTSVSMNWPADIPAKEYEGLFDQQQELITAVQNNPFLYYRAQYEMAQLKNEQNHLDAISRISRIEVAKAAMSQSLDAIPQSVSVALVTAGGCPSRSQGIFSGDDGRVQLKRTVKELPLEESTSLADGLSRAGDQIRDNGGEGTILVVSDGTDSCNGDPCAVAQSLHASLPNVRINVVDIQGMGDKQCIANPSGGAVYKTDNVRQAVNQMKEATQDVQKVTKCE